MPQAIYTIEELIATKLMRQGYWMVFNKGYNDVHAFQKTAGKNDKCVHKYLAEEGTDQAARAEFLEFMKTYYPQIDTYPVMDLVGLGYLIWPYLGSIAIDMQTGDDVYVALSEKYNDPEADGKSNNSVLWTMQLDEATAIYRARCESAENM
jgi:hypothetical protein